MNTIQETVSFFRDGFTQLFVTMVQNIWAKMLVSFGTMLGVDLIFVLSDITLLTILTRCMVLELVLSIIDLIKTDTWKFKSLFYHSIMKFPTYTISILFVAYIDYGIHQVIAVPFSFLELLLVYLTIVEILNSVRHLKYLGIPIPEIVLEFVYTSKRKIQQNLNMGGKNGNGEHKEHSDREHKEHSDEKEKN